MDDRLVSGGGRGLTLEESFGALVRQLRFKLPGAHSLERLAERIHEATGVQIAPQTLKTIEAGGARRPHAHTVVALCRFFFKLRVITTREDVVWFCLRAGYHVAKIAFPEGGDLDLELRASKETSFAKIAALVLADLGSIPPGDAASPLAQGLHNLMAVIATYSSLPTGAAARLEARVQRVLARDDPGEYVQIIKELERRFSSASSLDGQFRIAHMLARIAERRARYGEALLWSERAHHLASGLAVAGDVRVKEPLAALCEAVADACLNIGSPELWDKAHRFYQAAMDLRLEVKRELDLRLDISLERDAQSMLQLARYWTHVKEHDRAHDQFGRLWRRTRRSARPLFRAHVLKEWADDRRLAGLAHESDSLFKRALATYRRALEAHASDPPENAATEEIELHLNIGYCQRRLGEEARAVRAFRRALTLAHDHRDPRRVAYACLQLARSPLVQAEAADAAFYATTAQEIMSAAGAVADEAEARRLNRRLRRGLTRPQRKDVDGRFFRGEYADYVADPSSGGSEPADG